jgi:hypothetical protein
MGWKTKEPEFDAQKHSVQNCAVHQLASYPMAGVCYLSGNKVAGASSELHINSIKYRPTHLDIK